MSKNYGLAYMGSKSGVAPWVVEHLPAAPVLVDLFAGGCAITHAAVLSRKWKTIIANDITDAPSLFVDAVAGKYRDETRWISRADYDRLKDTDPYVRYCWSFGNNGRIYLYGTKIEPYKKACHYAVVLDDWTLLQGLCPEVWQAAKAAMRGCSTIHQRRLRFGPAIVRKLKELKDPSLLDSNPLYASCHRKIVRGTNPDATYLERLESLERLERLQSLESLERLQSLESRRVGVSVSRADYRAVEIPDNAVVYCDPPYKGTADYLVPFDSDAFYRWAADCPHPVYFSEYSAPSNFKRVAATQKCNRLNTNKANKAFNFEFIYWNGKTLADREKGPET